MDFYNCLDQNKIQLQLKEKQFKHNKIERIFRLINYFYFLLTCLHIFVFFFPFFLSLFKYSGKLKKIYFFFFNIFIHSLVYLFNF